ncbi:MAG: hypothetical protein ACRENC_10865, partial [Gemmatimonadaceae bacterium]
LGLFVVDAEQDVCAATPLEIENLAYSSYVQSRVQKNREISGLNAGGEYVDHTVPSANRIDDASSYFASRCRLNKVRS